MICPNCGYESSGHFCSSCGIRLPEPPFAREAPPAAPNPPDPFQDFAPASPNRPMNEPEALQTSPYQNNQQPEYGESSGQSMGQTPRFEQFHVPPGQKSPDNRAIIIICIIAAGIAVLGFLLYFGFVFLGALIPLLASGEAYSYRYYD